MSALAVNPAYAPLLTKLPPRVIRSEEQNEAYVEALYERTMRPNTMSFPNLHQQKSSNFGWISTG